MEALTASADAPSRRPQADAPRRPPVPLRPRSARPLTLAPALALLCAALHAPAPASAQAVQVSRENRTVSVTATERVSLAADTASVHIGYTLFGRDREAAYSAATTLSSAIIKALTDSGIPLDAIESDSQGIEPVQNFQVEHLSPADAANRRFQVQQSWIVRVPAQAASKTLDTAVLAGANQSGQIDWSLRDEDQASSSAAAHAIDRAHTLATQMVSPFGGKVGALLFASNDNESTVVRPMPMAAMHKSVDARQQLAINPRRIERSVTVHAVFAIE